MSPDVRCPVNGPQAWQRVLEMSGDIALVAAADGTLLWVSPSAGEIAGYEPAEVVGVSGFSFVHPDDLARVHDYFAAVLGGPGPHGVVEFRVRAADGRWVWVEERIINLLGDPEIGGLVAYLRDVTDRHELTRELTASEQRYRAIVETADEGIGILDSAGVVTFANRKLAELIGYPEGLVGRNVIDFVDADDVTVVAARVGVQQRGTERMHVRLRHATGRLVHAGVILMPFEADAAGQPQALVMVRDDTARHHYERDLQYATLHDPLTGLPNRVLLNEHLCGLQSRLQPGRRASLLLLNLNGLAAINQALGADAGDTTLTTVATRLLQAVDADDFVARVGGDEFAVVRTAATTATQAWRFSQSLAELLGVPVTISGETLRLTTSTGIALVDGTDGEASYRQASMALTIARSRGRGQVHLHDSEPLALPLERWRLEAELRQALDEGQLAVAYQPVVDLATGDYIGAEALARWHSPIRGSVPPSQFIPIAETSGLIEQLGAWVLSRACTDASAWPELPTGRRPTLSVNLSAAQLANPSLPDIVQRALTNASLRPDELALEVTETGVLGDLDRAATALQALRDIGVAIHIDDFGTGYASMLYVRHFPAQALKIDRSFVAGLGTSAEDAAIISATTTLATSTGLAVIAEGVETEQQAELLRQAGCHLAQGYLWSTALQQDEWLALLDTRLAARRPRATRTPRPTPEATSRILELHGTGASATTIAAALNREGVPAPGPADRWHRVTVAAALTTLIGQRAQALPS